MFLLLRVGHFYFCSSRVVVIAVYSFNEYRAPTLCQALLGCWFMMNKGNSHTRGEDKGPRDGSVAKQPASPPVQSLASSHKLITILATQQKVWGLWATISRYVPTYLVCDSW